MEPKKCEIHLKERTDSTDTERFFDGWLVGCQNVFGPRWQMCAMNSASAIKWHCEIEKKAFGLSIETKTVFENF